MKTSCAINFSKLGFMEKLTNPLLEWCGWEDFKRFPWSVIDHEHTLPSPDSGDGRQKSRCFQLRCRPGGVSGRWGCVSEPGHLLGGGPRAARGCCASRPALQTRHVPGIPAGAAALSPGISNKASLHHPPGEGGFFQENERNREKKTTQVMSFFLFSLELNIMHRSCERKGLLVG